MVELDHGFEVAIPYSSGLNSSRVPRPCPSGRRSQVAIPYSSGLNSSQERMFGRSVGFCICRNPLFIRSQFLTKTTTSIGCFGYMGRNPLFIRSQFLTRFRYGLHMRKPTIHGRNPLFIRSQFLTARHLLGNVESYQEGVAIPYSSGLNSSLRIEETDHLF